MPKLHQPRGNLSRVSNPSSGGRLICFAGILIFGWLMFTGDPARALVLTNDDGSGNVTKPLGFDEWDYVGHVNGLTGVYLGEGWVIATNHGGPGDLTLDGIVYPMFVGSEVQLMNPGGSLADLVMFQIFPFPAALPLLSLRMVAAQIGELAVLVGVGRARGTPTTWDPDGGGPQPALNGFNWDSGAAQKRYGTNLVAGLTPFLGTSAVFLEYDASQTILPEAQASNGDSGGAIFIIDGMGTQLAGIIYAIGPAPGQPSGTALYTNLTFAARIEVYAAEINSLLALPEPSGGGLSIGALLLLGLARRRARQSIQL